MSEPKKIMRVPSIWYRRLICYFRGHIPSYDKKAITKRLESFWELVYYGYGEIYPENTQICLRCKEVTEW